MTGGVSGIGHAVVRRFLKAGARVVIADVDEERGKWRVCKSAKGQSRL